MMIRKSDEISIYSNGIKKISSNSIRNFELIIRGTSRNDHILVGYMATLATGGSRHILL